MAAGQPKPPKENRMTRAIERYERSNRPPRTIDIPGTELMRPHKVVLRDGQLVSESRPKFVYRGPRTFDPAPTGRPRSGRRT